MSFFVNVFDNKNTITPSDTLFTFNRLADAFIQSDLQMRTTEALNYGIKTTKNRSKTTR